MADETQMSVAEAVRLAGTTLQGPVAFDDFAAMVLAIRPSPAKSAKSTIRNTLRWEWLSAGVLFVDPQRKVVAQANQALHGVRFRHVLLGEEIAAGALYLEVAEWAWLPMIVPTDEQLGRIQWLDADGHALDVPVRVDRLPSLAGKVQITSPGHVLAPWLARHGAQVGDAALITLESFDPPCWRLVFERAADRDEAAIARRNTELMDELHAALELASREQLRLQDALLSAHARLHDPQGYPGDPLLETLARDGRMACDGMRLAYIDEGDFLMGLLGGFPRMGGFPGGGFPGGGFAAATADEAMAGPAVLSPTAARTVYRFKVSPYRRATPWRQVEILGDQTLADLNRLLVRAFKHDSDHLGGFWRLVRRGATKHFREIELGTIDPFGDGDGADRRIADIDLEAGDAVKWVFDFGDWNEYRLVLEEVTPGAEAVAGEAYPRVVGQNKPRPLYCQHCLAEGRKVVATWVCIDCSNRQQTEVLICEECLTALHEDHYAAEWVY